MARRWHDVNRQIEETRQYVAQEYARLTQQEAQVLAAESPSPYAGLHPAIVGLLTLLPPAGSPFPQSVRERWLAAFRFVLEQVYPAREPRVWKLEPCPAAPQGPSILPQAAPGGSDGD